ncbi:uncharacterized protein F5Z01DRAFT_189181 [Emericellopsis atlantica]|uniref:Uncharacterized protein n=1 Tax=Emericellopsis atlantica TaxID=2614577 RepID=A0A9P7ZJ46_9HYPO|nr:uncharacterized protein F5Z01DRAFT_189181 [Emericellopsis atlantica]KAG9252866.1 hypothetical protein F5Z01DRAFT_189181 [Emericellopsis atlantica]
MTRDSSFDAFRTTFCFRIATRRCVRRTCTRVGSARRRQIYVQANYQQQASDNARARGQRFPLSSAQSSSPRPRPWPSMHAAMQARSHQRRVESISPPILLRTLSLHGLSSLVQLARCCRSVPHFLQCVPPQSDKSVTVERRLDSSGSLRQPTPPAKRHGSDVERLGLWASSPLLLPLTSPLHFGTRHLPQVLESSAGEGCRSCDSRLSHLP